MTKLTQTQIKDFMTSRGRQRSVESTLTNIWYRTYNAKDEEGELLYQPEQRNQLISAIIERYDVDDLTNRYMNHPAHHAPIKKSDGTTEIRQVRGYSFQASIHDVIVDYLTHPQLSGGNELSLSRQLDRADEYEKEVGSRTISFDAMSAESEDNQLTEAFIYKTSPDIYTDAYQQMTQLDDIYRTDDEQEDEFKRMVLSLKDGGITNKARQLCEQYRDRYVIDGVFDIKGYDAFVKKTVGRMRRIVRRVENDDNSVRSCEECGQPFYAEKAEQVTCRYSDGSHSCEKEYQRRRQRHNYKKV